MCVHPPPLPKVSTRDASVCVCVGVRVKRNATGNKQKLHNVKWHANMFQCSD